MGLMASTFPSTAKLISRLGGSLFRKRTEYRTEEEKSPGERNRIPAVGLKPSGQRCGEKQGPPLSVSVPVSSLTTGISGRRPGGHASTLRRDREVSRPANRCDGAADRIRAQAFHLSSQEPGETTRASAVRTSRSPPSQLLDQECRSSSKSGGGGLRVRSRNS